ncbi:hypothetical protein [Lentzea sp. CC55]|nr:hypothetical protein [Lentzea sp. CC55]MCG8927329.1 hypothetical protein [Lentzea sp. CC55]
MFMPLRVPDPVVGDPRDAVVAVALAAVCGTDLLNAFDIAFDGRLAADRK